MKDGFGGQRRFVGHKKKNHFRMIVVCMKYKCQRFLVFQGCCMKILDYWGLRCCTLIVVKAVIVGCGDDGCGWGIRSLTNPIRFVIPSGCSMNKLKHFLIKQVAPIGVSPYGIHKSQLVRQFFRQPSHAKYSENLIEYEIIELKNEEDVLKVLAQSNYWKRFCTIEILAIFNKPVIQIEEDMYPAQHISNHH